MENYFLILSAIEQNLAEVKKIQAEIVEVRSEHYCRFPGIFVYMKNQAFPLVPSPSFLEDSRRLQHTGYFLPDP